ncbi:MAG: DUF4153 domain-containing protein [Sphingomicrobium sp.]
MTMRHDAGTSDWPLRPWIMAAVCALAGLLFHTLMDRPMLITSGHMPAWREAGATFVAIAAIAFVLTVEQRRWLWSLAFALGWGAVVALVGYFTASYNHVPSIFEFPFFAGLFAVLLAAPLFQTLRDDGRWPLPYARLHGHAWTDAVIGAAAIGFIGIAFLLAWLIAGLFDLIGISVIKHLLGKGWFDWMLAGFAFGAAVGLLRERDALVATLQRLVMVVLGVLAPVLAAALILFLASLPFTGLSGLWGSRVPATPLMLLAGAGAVLLANAVIGNGADDGLEEGRATSRILRLSAMALVLAVLPLAIIAALSIGQRIGQYGWTPERMWGVVAVLVALAYGAIGWWAVATGRQGYDEPLRPLQTRLAIGLCGVALLLALPILDFGAISAQSQMARFAAGKVKPGEFDWQAMAFDFGPAGRARLAEIARSGPPDQRKLAATALAADNRYSVDSEVAATQSAVNLDSTMRVYPDGAVVPEALRTAISKSDHCRIGRCVLTFVGPGQALITGPMFRNDAIITQALVRDTKGEWNIADRLPTATPPEATPNLATAPVELRTVKRRQLYIDGKPVGEPFE